jgi:hypothetical protein
MSELYICNNAKDCKVKMGVGAPCHPHDHEGRFYGEWECGKTMKKVQCVKVEQKKES